LSAPSVIARGRSARGSIIASAATRSAWPSSRSQANINQKTMTILHQAMADEAELGLLARSLAVESGIGIRRRDMRLVRPLLAMELGFDFRRRGLQSRSIAEAPGAGCVTLDTAGRPVDHFYIHKGHDSHFVAERD